MVIVDCQSSEKESNRQALLAFKARMAEWRDAEHNQSVTDFLHTIGDAPSPRAAARLLLGQHANGPLGDSLVRNVRSVVPLQLAAFGLSSRVSAEVLTSFFNRCASVETPIMEILSDRVVHQANALLASLDGRKALRLIYEALASQPDADDLMASCRIAEQLRTATDLTGVRSWDDIRHALAATHTKDYTSVHMPEGMSVTYVSHLGSWLVPPTVGDIANLGDKAQYGNCLWRYGAEATALRALTLRLVGPKLDVVLTQDPATALVLEVEGRQSALLNKEQLRLVLANLLFGDTSRRWQREQYRAHLVATAAQEEGENVSLLVQRAGVLDSYPVGHLQSHLPQSAVRLSRDDLLARRSRDLAPEVELARHLWSRARPLSPETVQEQLEHRRLGAGELRCLAQALSMIPGQEESPLKGELVEHFIDRTPSLRYVA